MRVNYQKSVTGAFMSIAGAVASIKHDREEEAKRLAEQEKAQPMPESTPTVAEVAQAEEEQPQAPQAEQPQAEQQSALEQAGFQIDTVSSLGKRQFNPVQVEQEALQRLQEKTRMVSNLVPKPPTQNRSNREDTYIYKVNGGYRRGKKSDLIPSPPTTVSVPKEED